MDIRSSISIKVYNLYTFLTITYHGQSVILPILRNVRILTFLTVRIESLTKWTLEVQSR